MMGARGDLIVHTAVLLPRHYTDEQWFEHERNTLFATSWIFVGMAGDVARPDDYFRVELAGLDVIVQNCDGQLRAFVNSCSHRHARIHEELRGNRRLVCPYHGWSYDGEGRPAGIPHRENFPEVCARPGDFALRQLELQTVGLFIFVRTAGDGAPLRTYLSQAWGFLERVSASLDAVLDDFSGTLASNWKIAIENALEGYHVPLIHRSTLGAINQFSAQREDIVDHLPDDNGHSWMINAANAEWLRRWQRFEQAIGSWPFKFDHYVHQLVFPNLTVTSFLGYSFHIQRFQPDAVNRTTVHSRIYAARCSNQSAEGNRILRRIYEENREFTHRVFAEDQRACKLTYLGALQARRPAVLAQHLEKRIAHFQLAYLSVLPDAAPAGSGSS